MTSFQPVFGCGINYQEQIGGGAFGKIYSVNVQGLGKRVLKVTKNTDWKEIIAQSTINSENILEPSRLVGGTVGCNPPQIQILYHMGRTLSSYLESPDKDYKRSVFSKQLIQGLLDAFNTGILHHDIKEDNILVMSKTVNQDYRGPMKALHFDFGASQFSKDLLNPSGIPVLKNQPFTLWHISPYTCERIERSENVCSDDDIFSLGIVFLSMYSKTSFTFETLMLRKVKLFHETYGEKFLKLLMSEVKDLKEPNMIYVAKYIAVTNLENFTTMLRRSLMYRNTPDEAYMTYKLRFSICRSYFKSFETENGNMNNLVSFFTKANPKKRWFKLIEKMVRLRGELDEPNNSDVVRRATYDTLKYFLDGDYKETMINPTQIDEKMNLSGHVDLIMNWYKTWHPNGSLEHVYNIVDRYYRVVSIYQNDPQNVILNKFYEVGQTNETDTLLFLLLGCLFTEIMITPGLNILQPSNSRNIHEITNMVEKYPLHQTINEIFSDYFGKNNVNVSEKSMISSAKCVTLMLNGNLFLSSHYESLSSRNEIIKNLEIIKYVSLYETRKPKTSRRQIVRFDDL